MLNKASLPSAADTPDARVLLSYVRYKQDESTCDVKLKRFMERTQGHSPDETRRKLEMLLKTHKWGFGEMEDGTEGEECGRARVMILNSHQLTTLLDPKTTLSERCIKLLNTAVTVG